MAHNHRTVLASIVAAVLVAGGLLNTADADPSPTSRPAPPPIADAWTAAAGATPTAFIVHLSTSHTSTPADPDLAVGVDPDRLAAAIAHLGDTGEVTVADGQVWWRTDSGSEIVGTLDEPSQNPLAALAATPGVAAVTPLRDGTAVVTGNDLAPSDLAGLPGVADVETAMVDSVDAERPNDPYWAYAWHLDNTGWAYNQSAVAGADVAALDAWDRTRGAGAVVAVLDTGFDTTHPDLASALWSDPDEVCGNGRDDDSNGRVDDCHGWNYMTGSSDLTNGGDNRHGTWVAGTVAAAANNRAGGAGLAPAATVMPMVVGAGDSIVTALWIQAIYDAVDQGADVINASFSGPSLHPAATAAIQYAWDHGVLVVASASNDSADRDRSPRYPASINHPGVVSVGATTASDTVAGFSAWGATSVDLFAPGNGILTTHPDPAERYWLVNGTSFSAPLVAATVALIRDVDPTLDAAGQRDRLLGAVDPVPALAGRCVTGGRLNTAAAVGAGQGGFSTTFDGLAGLVADTPLAPTVTIVDPAASDVVDTVRIRVATRHQNQTWAVADLPVTVGSATYVTDTDGAIFVPAPGADLGGGLALRPHLTLPAGHYALVVDLAAGSSPVGLAQAASFVVAPAGAITPTTTPSPPSTVTGPTTTAPQPSASTTSTTTAAPGVTSPPSSTTVPAPPPGPSPTTTTPAPLLPTIPTSPTTAPTTPHPTSPGATSTTRPLVGSTTSTSTPPGAPHPTSPSIPSAPTTVTTRPATTTTTSPAAATSRPTRRSASGVDYPGNDPFQITRTSPGQATVGANLRITGGALPESAYVLVGGRPATVAADADPNSITVTVPTLVAGTYPVRISDTRRAASVELLDAVTIVSPSGSTPTTGSVTSTTRPAATWVTSTSTTRPGGSAPSTSTPSPSTTTPAVPTTAAADPVTSTTTPRSPTTTVGATATSSTTSTTSPAPAEITGPGGLRLVASPGLRSLPAGVWNACVGTCRGVDV